MTKISQTKKFRRDLCATIGHDWGEKKCIRCKKKVFSWEDFYFSDEVQEVIKKMMDDYWKFGGAFPTKEA